MYIEMTKHGITDEPPLPHLASVLSRLDAAIPLSPMLPDYLPLRFPHRHPLPLPRPQRDDTSRGVVRTVAPNTGPVDVEAVVQNCRHGDLLRPIALKDDVAIPSAIPAPRPLRDDSTNGTILLGERLHNAQINAGILPVIRSTTPFSSQPIPRTRRNILIPKPLKLKDDVTGGSVRLVVPGDGSNVTVEAGVETHKGGSNGSPLQNAQPHGTINQIPGLLEVQGAKQSQTSFETTHQSTRFSGIPVSQQGQSSGGSVKMVVGPKQGPVTVVAGVQNSRRPVREVERLPRMIDPLHRNHMHPLPVKKPSKMNLMHFPWNQRPIKIVNIQATAQPTVAPAKHHEKKCKHVTVNGVTICS